VTGDEDGPDTEPDWHNRTPAVAAASVAGLLLLAVLVYAVIYLTNDEPGGRLSPEQSFSPSVPGTTSSTTTSYLVPTVQTSQDDAPPGGPPTPAPPPTDEPAPETTADTTTADPYPTTTSGNADAI
jgi:hypothetical protein